MKQFHKRWHAIAAAAALAAGVAGVSGNAQAGVLAQSVLSVTNFRFIDSTGATLSINDFGVLIFADNTDVTANLNGVSQTDSAGSSVFGPLDLPQQCVGACGGFAENDFSQRLLPTVNVARGDTLLENSPLLDTGFPTGANAHTVAEVQAFPDTNGSTQSNLGLLATFTFSVQQAMQVGVAFDADIWLRALLTPDMLIGSNAQASSSWSIELTDAGTGDTIFSWTPDGMAGGITGGTEGADSCDLTRTVAAQLPGQISAYSCSGSFSAITDLALDAGVLYTLNIRHTSEADARAIPEPSILSLLGLGVLGLGFGLRRNKKA